MSEIRIVGTAHVSAQSVEDVKNAIEEFQPNIIAIELDLGRFHALKKDVKEPTVAEVLEVRNFNQLLIQWILSYLQRKIGVDVGVEPGSEMKAAIAEAEQRRIPVALVDRDIRLTLLRFWQSLGILGKIKMFFALVISIAEVDELEKVDIESMKDQSVIDMVMEEFRKFSPEGARSLIDERDAFIAHNLVRLKGQDAGRILAVVGAGHVNGIKRYLDAPGTLPPLDSLTRQPKSFPGRRCSGSLSPPSSSSSSGRSGSRGSASRSSSMRFSSGSSSTACLQRPSPSLPGATRTRPSPASGSPG